MVEKKAYTPIHFAGELVEWVCDGKLARVGGTAQKNFVCYRRSLPQKVKCRGAQSGLPTYGTGGASIGRS